MRRPPAATLVELLNSTTPRAAPSAGSAAARARLVISAHLRVTGRKWMCVARQSSSGVELELEVKRPVLCLCWRHQGQGEPRAAAAADGAVEGGVGLAPLFPRDWGLG